MDGQFVPNLTFGPLVVEAIRKTTKLPLDVHLMIQKPDNLISEFINAGANYITVHQEDNPHLNRTLTNIKELGAKAGVALNPSTPVDTLKEVFSIVDMVLIMSVNPGFGGQKFIENSIKKVKELSEIRDKNNYNFIIEVDGGLNKNNVKTISEAGCNAFVIGNSIYGSDNITAAAVELKNIISG
jgi:ribulose-phosphate 3-epimerase